MLTKCECSLGRGSGAMRVAGSHVTWEAVCQNCPVKVAFGQSQKERRGERMFQEERITSASIHKIGKKWIFHRTWELCVWVKPESEWQEVRWAEARWAEVRWAEAQQERASHGELAGAVPGWASGKWLCLYTWTVFSGLKNAIIYHKDKNTFQQSWLTYQNSNDRGL